MEAMHQNLTEATGGRCARAADLEPLKSLLTLHPLGGCAMGVSAETGVVDHLGQVFGYPEPDRRRRRDPADVRPCRNPSHTIAALAERIAAHVSVDETNMAENIDASIPQGIARAVHAIR